MLKSKLHKVDYVGKVSFEIINEGDKGSFIVGMRAQLNADEFVVLRQRYSYEGVPDLSAWEDFPEEVQQDKQQDELEK